MCLRSLSFVAVIIAVIAVAGIANGQTPAPSWPSPRVADKLLKYNDAYLRSEGGTCGYGNVYGLKGVVVAANTAFYSDDVSRLYHHDGLNSSPKTKADGCGVCYRFCRVDNATGAGCAVGIIADICDDEAACTQFPPSGYSFNLYDNDLSSTQLWDDVMGPGEGRGTVVAPTFVTLQQVSCPASLLDGDGSSLTLRWRAYSCCGKTPALNSAMEWTVGNHKVQVTMVEVRNSASGSFVPLQRSWTNKWNAPYDPDNSNLKWLVFNQEYTLRITGPTGSVQHTIDMSKMIESTSGQRLDSLETTNTGNNDQPYTGVYTLTGQQLPDFAATNGGSTSSAQGGTVSSTGNMSGSAVLLSSLAVVAGIFS